VAAVGSGEDAQHSQINQPTHRVADFNHHSLAAFPLELGIQCQGVPGELSGEVLQDEAEEKEQIFTLCITPHLFCFIRL